MLRLLVVAFVDVSEKMYHVVFFLCTTQFARREGRREDMLLFASLSLSLFPPLSFSVSLLYGSSYFSSPPSNIAHTKGVIRGIEPRPSPAAATSSHPSRGREDRERGRKGGLDLKWLLLLFLACTKNEDSDRPAEQKITTGISALPSHPLRCNSSNLSE